MAVNLSPVGGVAGQFFDNNGDPLVGGKLYTYAAGTTTPQATYTSSSGATANSNPIILNAGGRVPAEIWLTDGLVYKFVLYSSADQLIGSWDNIVGINSNFVNFVTSEEVQTATAGQTVFTLTTMTYQPGINNLVVYVDGVNQVEGGSYSFVETNSTTVTFTSGLHLGAVVKFVSAETVTTVGSNAAQVAYEPAGSGAVTTTVQAKLRETVSVKDFGAVGDGVTDDTAAIQAAVTYATSNNAYLFFPDGIYIVSDTITFTCDVNGYGTIKTDQVMSNKPVAKTGATYKTIRGISIVGTATDKTNNVIGFLVDASTLGYGSHLENVTVSNFAVGLAVTTFLVSFNNCLITNSNTNLSLYGVTSPALSEINLVNFQSCKFWGATEYAAWIGDTRPAGSITAFNDGWVVNFDGCDFENSTTRIQDVGNVNFNGCYWESPLSTNAAMDGKHVYVDGVLGNTRSLQFSGCYFRSGDYGVYCETAPRTIVMQDCTLNAIGICGLYSTQDNYGATYLRNQHTGSFSNGVEFHTGIRSGIAPSALNRYIIDGSNVAYTEPNTAILNSQYLSTDNVRFYNASSSLYRTYKTPKTSVAGTKSGTAITLTTPSDVVGFNGGDALVYGAVSTFITRVDYDNAILYVDEFPTSGAVSVSQVVSAWDGGEVGGTFRVVTGSYNNAFDGSIAVGGAAGFVDNNQTYAFKMKATPSGATPANGHKLQFISERKGVSDVAELELRTNGEFGTPTPYFAAATDDTHNLGDASKLWSVVYAATGTINTSDERKKQDIELLSSAEKRVAIAIKSSIKRFRFKDAVLTKGDGARVHIGVIAQEVAQMFEAEGLDPNHYGLFCYDEWEDDQGVTHSRYGIRYEELLAFVISAT